LGDKSPRKKEQKKKKADKKVVAPINTVVNPVNKAK